MYSREVHTVERYDNSNSKISFELGRVYVTILKSESESEFLVEWFGSPKSEFRFVIGATCQIEVATIKNLNPDLNSLPMTYCTAHMNMVDQRQLTMDSQHPTQPTADHVDEFRT